MVLERTNPFAMAAVLHYQAFRRHWSFYRGPGYELESHENFFLFNIGTEYSSEISEDFDISFNPIYENEEKLYQLDVCCCFQ
jgi:hypothetical protein